MNNWDDLKLILALSRYGTMSAAALSLNLSTATVSRRLERCSKEMGETLFVRRGQVWTPTSKAKAFIKLAQELSEGFPTQGDSTQRNNLEQRSLSLTLPLDVCMNSVSTRIPHFLRENPGLTIDTYHEAKSIAYGEVDMQLSHEPPEEGRLVRLRLGSVGYRLYTSEENISETQGWVQTLNEDRKSNPMDQTLREQFGSPRIKTTSISCALELLQEMPLAILLPTKLADRVANLVPWTPDVSTKYLPVWATYHESRRLDPDVRTTLDFLKDCFAD